MRNLFCLFAFLCLFGCVTPYQSHGLGGGYTDMALAPDVYKVSFRGNAYTSNDTVHNYALRRCAEIAFREGYNYFVVIGGNSSVDKSYYSSPTTIQSSGFNSFQGYGNIHGSPNFANYNLNGTAFSNNYTTIHPGFTQEMNRHNTVLVIKLLKSNKNIPIALDAQTILNNNFKQYSNI